MKTRLMIGGGAGFAADRIDAAVAVAEDLAAQQGPRYLIFETLAERTLALSQNQSQREDREAMMLRRLRAVLPICMCSGIRIVANFGSWTPERTAQVIRDLSEELGCAVPKVAVVTGDDLFQCFSVEEILQLASDDLPAADERLIAANAYIGAFAIAEALDNGADLVITGRVADPSLALGPMISALGLAEQDWDALACGTLAGHLIECGAQVCGGYYADPGFKDVPDLAWVGFPIVEISDTLQCLVRKAANTGGCVNRQTVIEQLLYEIHDPSAYLTPDVVLDMSEVTVQELGDNRVLLEQMRGRPKPDTLKVTLCFDAGWVGEAEISYAGLTAEKRARLAIDITRTRAEVLFPDLPLRCDLIGVVSAFASAAGIGEGGAAVSTEGLAAEPLSLSQDVRVRVATSGSDKAEVLALLGEVEALYTTGPAGGGGVRHSAVPRITTASALVPAERLSPQVIYFESTPQQVPRHA